MFYLKYVIIILLNLILAYTSHATEKVCAPYIESIDVPASKQSSAFFILQNKVKEQSTRTLVVPEEGDSINCSHSLESQLQWAQDKGCSLLLWSSIQQVDTIQQLSIRMYSADSALSELFKQSWKLYSWEDIDITMGQVSNIVHSVDFNISPLTIVKYERHKDSLYQSTNIFGKQSIKDDKLPLYVSGMFGGGVPFSGIGFSVSTLHHNYLMEMMLHMGILHAAMDFRVYKWRRDVEDFFYFGGGVGIMTFPLIKPLENFGYKTKNHINVTAIGGFVMVKNESLRVRIQLETISVIPSLGLRFFVDFGG